MKQNLHTHSIYCDGKDTIEALVQEAINKKFQILGFSGHGYCKPIDTYSMGYEEELNYIQEIHAMKKKYKNKIQLYLGIEQDVLGKRFDKKIYDYIIGSVHFIKVSDQYLPIDKNEVITKQIIRECGNFYNFAKAYYKEVKKLAYMEEVDIIGHLDLLMKFNENEKFISFEDNLYLQIAYDCIDICIEKGKIFEVNTGAIARGYRSAPYPYKTLLQYIQKKGGMIVLNSDCHNKEELDCYYEEAIIYMEECGFKSSMILQHEGFKEFRFR